ncbi:MAG: tetratricopeptide repeat protein [Elusimicrobia bacterium]|nr:tetratricopeptide repeat protein [Elusimicrobiota bacterium]
MMKLALAALAAWGGYYYLAHHCKFDDGIEFVSRHKDAAWAPRANYLIGMVYEQREDYPKAQDAFSRLLTAYPTCQYAADALLKMGLAAEHNGDWDTAKSALARYAEEHPDGGKIELARKRLELLRYQHGP